MEEMTDLSAAYRWLDDEGPAFGAPGVEPRWTSSEKDAVSTAYSASSCVWFTVSHGTLNEIYYPTIDRPQTRDMELLFSDGETFFHEEKRDLDYDFHYIDSIAPAVRVTASDLKGRYTVTKEFISDPHHPVVLMNVKISGDEDILSRLKCYALLAPHLNGGGAGNSARSLDVAGKRCLLAWKGNTMLAMGADCGFTRSSCGYVGTSDGYQDLCTDMKMTWQFGQALDGNISVMGEIDVAANREFTIAISFGDGSHAAIAQLMQTLSTPYDEHQKRFLLQWTRSISLSRLSAMERVASQANDAGRLMHISHNVLLTHEDKTYSGAFIASASIPWGASKGDADLGGYHLVWTRDMVQTATALLATGRTDTAMRALVYLACTQRTDGSFAQNFWIDGTPYWTGIQLDEVAFPIILAWRLWKADGLGNFDIFPFVERAAAFLVRYAPVTQQERWEETAGYSPSTLAAVIAALVCAADIARSRQASELGSYLEAYADWIESHLDEWTTTTDGILLPDVKYHYVRIQPPAAGEPFYNDQLAPGCIRINNREPGERTEFEAREVVDAGFLELVRYGIRRADDPLIIDSLKVVDHVLKIETPFGDCWRRYNHDGYGQKKDGAPYDGSGQGRAWPILTGERGHYELCAGGSCSEYIKAIENFSSGGGMLPEQVWDYDDIPSRKMFRGRPAGSAQPLVWAHAEYLKLLRSASDGRVFDRISVVEARYTPADGKRTFTNHIEIFEVTRPLSTVIAGHTLRIADRRHFHVVYTFDNWATTLSKEARSVGYPGSFVDLPTTPDQGGNIIFTLSWTGPTGQDEWLGRNIDVSVIPPPASKQT
jgi:glucoamylase